VSQEEGGRESLGVGVEVAPHVVLDPLPGAQRREARAEPRQSVESGQENDHARVKGEREAADTRAVAGGVGTEVSE